MWQDTFHLDPEKWRWRGRELSIALLVISLGFAAFTVSTVWTGRIVVPAYDQWMFLYWFRHVLSEGIDLQALWQPHNGHRLPIPRLIFYARNTLGGGDPRLLVIANLLLQAGTITLLARAVWRDQRLGAGAMRAVLATITIVLLSWTIQFENFYWGLQIIFVLATFLAVVALGLFATSAGLGGRRPVGLGAGAVLAGLAACGTFSVGLAIWPALLVMALALRAGAGYFVMIAGAALLAVIAYLAGPGDATGTVLEAVGQPFEVLAYVARFLGPPVASDDMRSYIGGAVLLAGCWPLIDAVRGHCRHPVAALHAGLVAFGLGAALMIALARLEGGVGGGGTSRYAAFSMLYWVGLLCHAGARLVERRFDSLRSAFYGACLTAFVVLVLPSQSILPQPFIQTSHRTTAAALSLVVGTPNQEAVRRYLYPDVRFAQELTGFLVQRKYGLFGSAFVQSLGQPVWEAYRRSGEPCPASWQAEALPGGLRLTGRFASWRDRAARLVVVDADERVSGLGVPRVGGRSFIAYARGSAPHSLYGVRDNGLCLAAVLEGSD